MFLTFYQIPIIMYLIKEESWNTTRLSARPGGFFQPVIYTVERALDWVEGDSGSGSSFAIKYMNEFEKVG